MIKKEWYAQEGEDRAAVEFFAGRTGTLLDIGANDGISYSNTYKLIQNGWAGVMVEASPVVFKKLTELYAGNPLVKCINRCVAAKNERVTFYRNTIHSNYFQDLLSTINENFYEKWKTMSNFKIEEIETVTFNEALADCENSRFEFVSIDTEGTDYEILTQIDLAKYGVELICVEYAGIDYTRYRIAEYCSGFGFTRVILNNGSNIMIAK
jgi:FkbM family methyltransferase